MEVSVEGVRKVLIFGEVDCWGERETWYRTVCVQGYIRKSWYWRLVHRESMAESMTSAGDYSQMTSFQPQNRKGFARSAMICKSLHGRRRRPDYDLQIFMS